VKLKLVAASAALALALVGMASPAVAAAPTTPGRASGIVTADGAPVAGIPIGWFSPVGQTSGSVTTGSDGKYSLPLPPIGTKYYLSANLAFDSDSGPDSANPSYIGEFYGAGGSSDYEFQTLHAHSSTTADVAQDVALQSGGSVSGSSADLADAHIGLIPAGQTTNPQAGGYADSSGAFSFTHYVPGVYRLYSPAHSGFAPYFSAPIELGNGDDVVINPRLATGATIQGSLTADSAEQTDAQLSGDNVVALNLPSEVEPDSSGHYQFTGLPPGTYTVTYEGGSGDGEFASQKKTVRVIAGQSVTNNVALTTGGTITGTVDVADDSDAYQVQLLDSSGDLVAQRRSNAGSFVFNGLAPGTYRLLASDDENVGWADLAVSVASHTTQALGAIALTKKPLTLSGTITGGHSGQLLFSRVDAAGETDVLYGATFTTSGKYKVTDMVPGTYDVTVQATSQQVTLHTLKFSTTVKQNYPAGPPLVKVTGTVELEGASLKALNAFLFTAGGTELSLGTSNGKISAGAHFGTYTSPDLDLYSGQGYLQPKSAYYFQWPTKYDPLVITTGKTKALGVVDILVRGGLN
jgi:hypothetical protein